MTDSERYEQMYDIIVDLKNTVNRQKAEIERLQHILISFMSEIEAYEQKHDVYLSNLPKIIVAGVEKENVVKQIKSGAIKEFWGKLKNYCDKELYFDSPADAYAFERYGDGLVKEMEETMNA